jgi:hypothetical protein
MSKDISTYTAGRNAYVFTLPADHCRAFPNNTDGESVAVYVRYITLYISAMVIQKSAFSKNACIYSSTITQSQSGYASYFIEIS